MTMYEGYVTNNLPPEQPKVEEVNMDNYLDSMSKLKKIYDKIIGKWHAKRY